MYISIAQLRILKVKYIISLLGGRKSAHYIQKAYYTPEQSLTEKPREKKIMLPFLDIQWDWATRIHMNHRGWCLLPISHPWKWCRTGMTVGNQSSQKWDHITIYMVSSRLGSSYVMMVAGGRQKKKELKRRSRHQIVNTKRLAASGKRTINNIHYNVMKLTS